MKKVDLFVFLNILIVFLTIRDLTIGLIWSQTGILVVTNINLVHYAVFLFNYPSKRGMIPGINSADIHTYSA